MKLLLDINLSREGIDNHWKENPDFRTLDHHKSSTHTPYEECVIRELVAGLEWEDLAHVNEVTLVEAKP